MSADDRPPLSADDRPGAAGGPNRSTAHPLRAAIDGCRRDPVLFVPFALTGVLLAIVDWLRQRDPIPAIEREGLGSNGVTISIEYVVYPTGIPQTVVPYESLVALEFSVLAWGLTLQALSLGAIGVAGAVTMARAMDERLRPRAVGAVVGFVVAMDLLQRLLGSIETFQQMGLVGIVPLALYLVVLVQLFPLPGLLVTGRSPSAALRQSRRRVAGRGWSVFGLVLAIGLSAWLLASVPLGTVVSSVLVAPVHAVAIVALAIGSGQDVCRTRSGS